MPIACNIVSQVIIDDFDEEHKARLLQFVTGTSGVISRVTTRHGTTLLRMCVRYLRRASGLYKVMTIIFASLQ